jgi:riboflavin kinase/FMN adenylyltransferase
MRIIRRPSLPLALQGSALTIGNFDGVHLGHAELLREVVRASNQHGLVSTVVTFSPHPKEFFQSNFGLDRIATLRNRVIRMKELGIEQVWILPFNASLASLPPERFVQNILVNQLNAKHIWVGDDFRFGAKRAGNFELLKTLGATHHFEVHDLPEVHLDGVRVSSSNIRESLKKGQVGNATRMLGHPLVYSGHVTHGKKLGRTLGFPTLNLPIQGRGHALKGVLAVWVHGLSNAPLPAVACLGVRPTIEESNQILLEVYIPNWEGNAYGRQIHVEVQSHIRPEARFETLDGMVKQMHEDTKQALALLANNTPQITHTGC